MTIEKKIEYEFLSPDFAMLFSVKRLRDDLFENCGNHNKQQAEQEFSRTEICQKSNLRFISMKMVTKKAQNWFLKEDAKKSKETAS